jgi:uncharacterized protein YbjQ (UPF0145 family)
MIIATIHDIPGYDVSEILGIVQGNTIRARSVFRDLLAFLKNVIGGEIEEYTKLLAESRDQAVDRMIEQAEALGADAILDMRFSTSEIMSGAAEILAYGTAVKLKKK